MQQPAGYLSKREQQIMEIAYKREKISASELEALLPGAPSNSTVRTLLRILEGKGHLRHIEEGGRYVYLPAHPKDAAAKRALRGVVDTFFQGSLGAVVATLLSDRERRLSPEELDRLQQMIDQAKEEGR